MYALTVENPHNLDAYRIIEILLVPYNAHVVSKNQDKFILYVNNYINWDQFNQLYDFNYIENPIRNVNAVTRNFRLILTRVNNHRLEVAKEER